MKNSILNFVRAINKNDYVESEKYLKDVVTKKFDEIINNKKDEIKELDNSASN